MDSRSACAGCCASLWASAWVGRARRLSGVDRGCPAAEELQGLLGARAGFGGVGEDRQPGVCREIEPVVAQVELADDRMVECLTPMLWKRRLDASPAQVALAWLLVQGDDIAPIPGTKRVPRVEENTAADAIELSAEHLERLNDLTPAAGERHDETNMARIER